MNHPLEEIASLYVLDQLEPHERIRFEEQLASDPALAALVRDYESAFAAGIRSLPQTPPPARVLDNIEGRLNALETPKSEFSHRPPPVARFPWAAAVQWGIAAVITVSLATLAIQSLRAPAQPVFVVVGLDANRSTFAELATAGPTAKDPDARFIQLAATAANLWRNPEARPLPATTASAGNHGYALFDPGSEQGFIAIEQLPVLTDNQRYHLWVVDDDTGRIRDGGVLPLTGVNRGLYSFALDPATGRKSARPNFFITVEDTAVTPAPAKPSGKVVLGREAI